MQIVTINQYIRADGGPDVETWYKTQSNRTRARFNTTLGILAQRDRAFWERQEHGFSPAAKLEGDGGGIVYEIRFNSDDVQYRPLGFFGPANDDSEFTITLCNVKEIMNAFYPERAAQKAYMNALAVRRNPRHISEWILRP